MKDKQQIIQDEDYAFPYHYIPEFDPGYRHHYSWPWGLYYISALEFILGKAVSHNPRSVVDIGTGDGRLVRELSRMLPKSSVVGIDYSKRSIDLARSLNPTLEFHRENILETVSPNQYELATLIEVFEHIPLNVADDFVGAVRKLVRTEGSLIVTVPHKNIPVSKKHYRHFDSASLTACFDPHFRLESVTFLDQRSVGVSVLRKMLENEYFILNHWGVRNRLYKIYKKYYLETEEVQCGRVYAHFRPRS